MRTDRRASRGCEKKGAAASLPVWTWFLLCGLSREPSELSGQGKAGRRDNEDGADDDISSENINLRRLLRRQQNN